MIEEKRLVINGPVRGVAVWLGDIITNRVGYGANLKR